MEPRVFIHPKTINESDLITSRPKIEPSPTLPEFKMVSSQQPCIPEEESFLTMDLFEVEKVDKVPPEFLEIIPKPTKPEPRDTETIIDTTGSPVFDTVLPEWQPINEQTVTSLEPSQLKNAEDVPEFERVDSFIIPEPQQESDEWETSSQRKEPLESSVHFLPVGSPEPVLQKFSQRQEWEARRAQRKKEKEAKKLKKIKLKKLKKKTRFSEQAAGQSFIKQPPVFKQVDETPVVTEHLDSIEPAIISIDYNVFSGIESIDEKTAEILYKNGYFSVENIKDATIDDLVSIRGIKRKLAKQIKREIEQKHIAPEKTEFTPIKHKTTKKRGKKKHTDSTEWESESTSEKNSAITSPPICKYQGFTLYKRTIKRHDKKNKTIHFFSKVKPKAGKPCHLPNGYQIAVNHKTRIPYIKKNRK